MRSSTTETGISRIAVAAGYGDKASRRYNEYHPCGVCQDCRASLAPPKKPLATPPVHVHCFEASGYNYNALTIAREDMMGKPGINPEKCAAPDSAQHSMLSRLPLSQPWIFTRLLRRQYFPTRQEGGRVDINALLSITDRMLSCPLPSTCVSVAPLGTRGQFTDTRSWIRPARTCRFPKTATRAHATWERLAQSRTWYVSVSGASVGLTCLFCLHARIYVEWLRLVL